MWPRYKRDDFDFLDLYKNVTDILNEEIKEEKEHPTNCKNCGAPLHSCKCDYCGSEY